MTILYAGDKVTLVDVYGPSLLTVKRTTMGIFFRHTQYVQTDGGLDGWVKADKFRLVERDGHAIDG